ncbi:MAG: 30S ribosomal protein S2 [Parvibaculales bacterium]
MALPDFSMRQLLEAGVHFGHQKHRWDPKMESYIFGVRNNIHIMDLSQTVPLLHQALLALRDTVAGGGRVLFVGTKRQASEVIARTAKECAQYYINFRWLGGTLTNWETISNSIKRLNELETMLMEDESKGLTKKERLNLTREHDKLERAIGGIKNMGGLPDIMFIIDSNKEAIAIQEARRLNIPIICVLDSNSNPEGITYPIPGNDDALRSIEFYCQLASQAVIDGIAEAQQHAGTDIGEMNEAPEIDLEAAEQIAKKEAAEAKKKKSEEPKVEVQKIASKKAVMEKAEVEKAKKPATKPTAEKAPAKKAAKKETAADKPVKKKAAAKKEATKKTSE